MGERDDMDVMAQYPWDAMRIKSLCDFLRLLDDLAHLIDCAPKLQLTRPLVSYKVLFGPITGAQYRLRGPHALPATSRAALLNTPTSPLPLVVFNLVNLVFHNTVFRSFVVFVGVYAML